VHHDAGELIVDRGAQTERFLLFLFAQKAVKKLFGTRKRFF
jgi:hypothetical protein